MSHQVTEPTRLRPQDAVAQAIASISARPSRALLTGLGTLLGVAWFVAALGLVSTASGQVAATLTRQLPTQVLLMPARARLPAPGYPFPASAEQRVEALHGVLAAGTFWHVQPRPPVAVPAVRGRAPARTPVVAASPGFLAAAGARVTTGRTIGRWDQASAAPVCLLGDLAARALRVPGVAGQPQVTVGGVSCAVIGIVARAPGAPWLRRSVLLPATTARVLWGTPPPRPATVPRMLIRTRPGAAAQVGREAPYAVSPASPHRFTVVIPRSPVRLRAQVSGALGTLFTALALVGLVVGALAIITVNLVSALGRVAELSLYRAVGAGRLAVAGYVLAESAIIGLVGGLAGASLGAAAVVLAAVGLGWTPVIAPQTLLAAPLAGAAAGALAWLAAALRAAMRQPARTLSAFSPD